MRRINKFLVILLSLLFCFHLINAILLNFYLVTKSVSIVSRIFFVVFLIHVILGIVLSFTSIKTGVKTKKWYAKQNAGFWTKRITGLLMVIFGVIHSVGKLYFTSFSLSLIINFIFYATIYVHFAVSVKSILIKMGVTHYKKTNAVILIIATVVFAVLIISTFFIRF